MGIWALVANSGNFTLEVMDTRGASIYGYRDGSHLLVQISPSELVRELARFDCHLALFKMKHPFDEHDKMSIKILARLAVEWALQQMHWGK